MSLHPTAHRSESVDLLPGANAPLVADITVVDDPVATQKVLFIAGWGRSGSTLFANLLGGSASAQNLGEFRYLWARGLQGTTCGCGQAVTACPYWTAVLDRAGWSATKDETDRFDQQVGSTAIFRQLGAMLTGRVENYRSANAEHLESIAAILDASADPGVVLVDSSKSIPFLINIAGDPRFDVEILHLTRDPRAVAYSWSRLTNTQDADGVTFPRFSAFRSSIYWTIFNLAPLRFTNVNRSQRSYEDFVASPRSVIADVCEQYGLEFPEHDWDNGTTVTVEPQHTISGNPSRFRLGATSIREDQRWKTDMRRRDRAIVTVCTAPARWILAVTQRRGHQPQTTWSTTR